MTNQTMVLVDTEVSIEKPGWAGWGPAAPVLMGIPGTVGMEIRNNQMFFY